MKKIIVRIISILFLVFSLFGCNNTSSSKSTKVIRIGFPGTQNFLSGVGGIAQDKKYLEDELSKLGYTVEYIPFVGAGPAVNEALTSNDIDIAIYADFPGLLSKSNGVDTRLIGISDNRISSALVVNIDSDITSVKDLKGKKIGFTKGTYMHKYLYQILELNGVSKDEVELINTTSGDAALQGGTIDALVTTDGGEALLVVTKKIARTIDSSSNHPEIMAQSIIVANTTFIENNPKVGISIHKSFTQAKNYMKESTKEAYNILTKSGYSEESVKFLYGKDSEKFDYITLKVDEESKKKLEDSKKFMLDNKLISKDFSIEDWTDNSYYDKSLEK